VNFLCVVAFETLSALETGTFLTSILSLAVADCLELEDVPYYFASTTFFLFEVASLATEVLFFLALVAALGNSRELLSPS